MSGDVEKQLLDNLDKCRCCFRMIIDDRKSIKMSEEIKSQFASLTQIELLDSEYFGAKICQLCESDLRVFATLRADLIEKQKSLYDLVGLNEEDYLINFAKPEQIEDPTAPETADKNVEMLEDEDEEEAMSEDEEIYYEVVKNDEYSVGNVKEESKSFIYENEEASTTFELLEIVKMDSSHLNDESRSSSSQMEIILCKVCNIDVPKSQFDTHEKNLHVSCDCQYCDESFESKILRKQHIDAKHNQQSNKTRRAKRFTCHLCVREYENRKQLDDHIRSFHEKERNSQCYICSKKFYHRDLKKHIVHVHGEKNIACPVCGKNYTCVENLKLHMRYHEDPKFECSIEGCGKKFHQKILLDHHMLKHSDERTIICAVCSASFLSARDLKRHTERVHEKVMRRCPLCDASFGRKDKLRVHVMKRHKDLSEFDMKTVLDEVKQMRWNEV